MKNSRTRADSSQKKKRNLLIRLALILFAGYVIVMLVQLQMQINASQTTIDDKTARKVALEEENDTIKDKLEKPDDVLKEAAEAQGYYRPDQDIGIEVPKN